MFSNMNKFNVLCILIVPFVVGLRLLTWYVQIERDRQLPQFKAVYPESLLLQAFEQKDDALFILELEKIQDVDLRFNYKGEGINNRLIELAIYTENVTAVKMLIDRGSRVNEPGPFKDPLLHSALPRANWEIIECLLQIWDSALVKLRQHGGAGNFSMRASWRQKCTGTINLKAGVSNIRWTDGN